MKRSSDARPGASSSGRHPEAATPLSAFQRIVVSCNDCGDITVLEAPQLAELTAVPTFGDLWRLSFCRACRASGAGGPANVDLRGETLREAPRSEPQWSQKPVFADDRSDPHPALPRRPMFRR